MGKPETTITDKTTGLIIKIEKDDSNKITATFSATKIGIIKSIGRQLAAFELSAYGGGTCLHVERRDNTDGSITISRHVKKALLFIAEHQFTSLNLDPETRTQLRQVCSGRIVAQDEGNSLLGMVSQTLFHRKLVANQTSTALLPDHPQQDTPKCLIQ